MPSKKAKKPPTPKRRSRSPRRQPTIAEAELQSLLQLIDEPEPPNRPYPRKLKAPILRASELDLMLRGSPDEQERLRLEDDLRIFAEQLDKLFLLLDHFGIPRTNRLRWFHLALELARQHMPGMKTGEPKPRRGPKSKWGAMGLDAELIYLVKSVERERQKGVADAVRIVQRRYPEWAKYAEDSLRVRYSEAVERLAPDEGADLIERFRALLLPDEPSPK